MREFLIPAELLAHLIYRIENGEIILMNRLMMRIISWQHYAKTGTSRQ
jgi:hypothetical protein